MSYSVDLEHDSLRAHSEAAARQAIAVLLADSWMRLHLAASSSPRQDPPHGASWFVVLDSFDGCYWHEPSARAVWLAIAPHLVDGSFLEFREEGGRRYRIRWEGGRVFEEFPARVIWETACEITPELLE